MNVIQDSRGDVPGRFSAKALDVCVLPHQRAKHTHL